jgi:hypothetical protein
MGDQKPFVTAPCRIRLLSTSFDHSHREGHIEWTLNPKYNDCAEIAFGDTRKDEVSKSYDDEYETTVLMTSADQLLTFFNQIGCPCVVDVVDGVLQVEVYDTYRE